MVNIMPAFHYIESRESIDIVKFGSAGDQCDHVRRIWFLDYLWRELRINQHYIGANLLDLSESFANRRVVASELIIADDCIGAKLPKHQVGVSSDHVCIKAFEHIANVLAAYTAIKHSDWMVGKTLCQLNGKSARISGRF